jgi:post-segregation antitoxin (ccd killing protein)
LAARAKELGINLSAVSAQAIERAVRDAETRKWQEDNDEAFEYVNAHFRKHGLFADRWRKF